MNYLDVNSLFQTVDHVSEALFYDSKIEDDEKYEIVDFILNQHGKPRTYADSFAPTESDLEQDLFLFTGERIKTIAGRCHMIGEEASRILRIIGGNSTKVQIALEKADLGLLSRINSAKNNPRYIHGTYCCKACTCSLWLNISSGGIFHHPSFLVSGLQYLKDQRDGKGSWKGFPGNYILYVLNELEPNLVLDELKYAGNSIERKLKKRSQIESKYDARRKELYVRLLNKMNKN